VIVLRSSKSAASPTPRILRVSYRTVARMLGDIGFSLQANSRTREGKQHSDRDAQFQYINKTVRSFQRRGLPVISVDAKKQEIVGNFQNRGREWQPTTAFAAGYGRKVTGLTATRNHRAR